MASDTHKIPMQSQQIPLWRATLALQLSSLVHVFCLALALIFPHLWQWALGIFLLNHLGLTIGVMQPRSRLLGPNMTRLPAAAIQRGEVVLTFDDGPDPQITPQVLDLLDQYGATASFFCIASKVAAYPALTQEIIRRGHSVENHTHHHPHAFALFGPSALQREIDTAQRTIQAVTGVAPVFFRAPMEFRNPLLAPIVQRAGLHYATWTRRGYDTFATDPEPVLKRLQRGLAAGDILLLHDGRSTQLNGDSSIILQVLPRLLEQLKKLNLKPVSLTAACGYV